MANLITKFAVANHSDIQSLIDQKKLNYPTYIFCRDTNTMVFIDKNGNMQDIKGHDQGSVIPVDVLPEKDIKRNTFYLCNGIGYLLINDILVPVFKEISEDSNNSSYDELTETPIVNKRGTIVSPVVLSNLDVGCYSVSGQYQIGNKLPTTYIPSSNVIVLVESDDKNKYITRIDGRNIVVYTVSLDTMDIHSDEYATQSWIQTQGYSTESYVDEAIENLYNRIIEETMVVITKLSQLENDMGFISINDMKEVGDEDIANLF